MPIFTEISRFKTTHSKISELLHSQQKLIIGHLWGTPVDPTYRNSYSEIENDVSCLKWNPPCMKTFLFSAKFSSCNFLRAPFDPKVKRPSTQPDKEPGRVGAEPRRPISGRANRDGDEVTQKRCQCKKKKRCCVWRLLGRSNWIKKILKQHLLIYKQK